MENSCLTFATPSVIVGDRSAVDVCAHEISHVSLCFSCLASLPDRLHSRGSAMVSDVLRGVTFGSTRAGPLTWNACWSERPRARLLDSCQYPVVCVTRSVKLTEKLLLDRSQGLAGGSEAVPRGRRAEAPKAGHRVQASRSEFLPLSSLRQLADCRRTVRLPNPSQNRPERD